MKSASTPRTASGKICKICSKKGSPCHLHTSGVSGGVSGGASPKKSSPNAKFTPKSFENLEYLPLPALQQVLLNIADKAQLSYVCRNSRQAAKVCKTAEFKRLYIAKYMGLFVGHISHTREAKTHSVTHVFQDENGNNLEYIERGIGRGTIKYRSTKTWDKLSRGQPEKTFKGFELDINDKTLRYIDFTKSGRYWSTSMDANDWWQNKNLFPLFHSIDPVVWPTKASVTYRSVLEEVKRVLSGFKITFD